MTGAESLVGIREENWGFGRNTALCARYDCVLYSQDHMAEMIGAQTNQRDR